LLSSVPDQKRSSKVSASRSARLSTLVLRKMITHEAIEAPNNNTITSCTGREACRISCRISSPPSLVIAGGSVAARLVLALAASSGRGSTAVAACIRLSIGVMPGSPVPGAGRNGCALSWE